MEMWLFFTIFGAVIFIPSSILFLFLNRFRNTIVVLMKVNGALKKIIINNKTLEIGQITKIEGKRVKPIPISKDEIIYGKWRRWIIKGELESTAKSQVTDKEVEEYLNNEDLLKLYLAGKFKDTLILLLGIIIAAIVVSGIINGYMISSKQCLDLTNTSMSFIQYSCENAVRSVIFNGTA